MSYKQGRMRVSTHTYTRLTPGQRVPSKVPVGAFMPPFVVAEVSSASAPHASALALTLGSLASMPSAVHGHILGSNTTLLDNLSVLCSSSYKTFQMVLLAYNHGKKSAR